MKRSTLLLAMLLACITILSGCKCSHQWDPATCDYPKSCQHCGVIKGDALGHRWKNATCNGPKTCEICNETEGRSLAHQWTDATCTKPKTCTACGAIEGDPLGHIWQAGDCGASQICTICSAVNGEALGHSWVEATCDTPKTCTLCNLTEGKALGHNWIAATTEAPKTCSICGKTEGSAIKTDQRFSTAACKCLFGSWEALTEYTAEDFGLANHTGSYTEAIVYTFRHDGTMTVSFDIDNIGICNALTTASILERLYADYDSKEAADLHVQSNFGVTAEEYAAMYADVTIKKRLQSAGEYVYYVSDDTLYMAHSWNQEMIAYALSIKDSKLTLIDDCGTPITLTYR